MFGLIKPHKVGLTTTIAGIFALIGLSFGSIATSRIASGAPVILADLGLRGAVAALAPLAVALLASLVGSRTRAAARIRTLMAALEIVVLFAVSGSAAAQLVPVTGDFARYSIGGGVWAAAFCSFALFVGGRRELDAGPAVRVAVTLIIPAGLLALAFSGGLAALGISAEYRNVKGEFWVWFAEHVAYAGVAMAVALVLGVGLGIAAHRRPRMAHPIFTATSLLQTIPGLAMIGILAVPLGMVSEGVPGARSLGIGVLGWAPVVIALTLYALLSIVRNTYAGLQSVPAATVEAGRGMGLTSGQLLRKVELPLAAPVLFSGLRTAAQQTIGNATLAVFVSAGALGRPIFTGVAQTAYDLVLLGSIALVVLALSVDIALRVVQRLATPAHVGGAGS